MTASMSTSTSEDLLQPDDVVKDRWKVVSWFSRLTYILFCWVVC